ncbi:hypothetical protein KUTeg_012154 [Tegillarca granosa]|uniref:Ionotropic glutamate receptor C-terminal domain-containing protein n=1 Tax=Tegillarca granosa TaxID=220873 RepID=A0ABQ9EYY2_TEGGR|nr:hypothetical protein KUTeg_012154 [Tegillarca granosa]
MIIEVNRETVMDFTYPIYFDSWTFLMRRPQVDKKWLLLSSLSWQVILCIAAALPVFTGLLYIMEYKNPYFTSRKQTPYTYHQLLWYVYGSILARGNGNTSFSNSGSILISTWWIFTIVVLATYSGNLVAVLSVTLEEAPFNTFEELVDQNQYKWGTLGGAIYLSIMEVI